MLQVGQQSGQRTRVLVVVVGDYRVTGVLGYLEDRLPLLIERYHTDITLFVPGTIKEPSRAKIMVDAGIRIVEGRINLSSPIKRRIGLKKKLNKLLDEYKFDVIHINTGSRLVNLYALKTAKRYRVPVRIAHSHTAGNVRSPLLCVVESYYRHRICSLATDLLACSNEAGEFLFGADSWKERGVVARNGVDIQRFSYSSTMRSTVRKQFLKEDESIVVGFVGRLSEEKNPQFVIEIVRELTAFDKKYVCWIVGNGSLLSVVKTMIADFDLEHAIRLFGSRDDVANLLQGIDVFVMPSKYEGFGISLVEAQVAGAPCFASNHVSKTAWIEGCPVTFIALDKGPSYWANAIHNDSLLRNPNGAEMARLAGIDLDSSLDVLIPFYR